MGVSGTRGRALAAPVVSVAVLVVAVTSGWLLAGAEPYLDPWQVWALPLTATAYAAAATYVVTSAPRPAAVSPLLVCSVALAAPALSAGSAQSSGAWVVIGALAVLAVPAAGWLGAVTLRGHAVGPVTHRLLVAAAVLAVAQVVVTALVQDPAAWGWCRCRDNPVGVGVGADGFERLRPWLTGSHLVTVALVVLAVGAAWWDRPGRRGPAEVAVPVGLLVAAAGWAVADAAELAGTPTNDSVALLTLGLLALLAAHVAARAVRRPSRAHVADLLLAARERSDPSRLRELVARAVGDPGAEVFWWDQRTATYVDHAGRPQPSAVRAATHVLDVSSDRGPIARVVTEGPLVEQPLVRESVAEALRLSTENRLLQEELAATLAEVRESRSRIVQASDEARRRIERDLHDGAQQLLISTGAKLNLASSRVDPDRDRDLADALGQASDELGRALRELRSLARGIAPTALVHGSLPDALEDLALRCPVPTSLSVTPGAGAADVGAEAAAAAYFVVGESLANVAKHARAATAQVRVELGDPLRIEVRDDGCGGAEPSRGTGLTGIADRVAAVGGDLVLDSSPAGTRVTVTLPNPAPNPVP